MHVHRGFGLNTWFSQAAASMVNYSSFNHKNHGDFKEMDIFYYYIHTTTCQKSCAVQLPTINKPLLVMCIKPYVSVDCAQYL